MHQACASPGHQFNQANLLEAGACGMTAADRPLPAANGRDISWITDGPERLAEEQKSQPGYDGRCRDIAQDSCIAPLAPWPGTCTALLRPGFRHRGTVSAEHRESPMEQSDRGGLPARLTGSVGIDRILSTFSEAHRRKFIGPAGVVERSAEQRLEECERKGALPSSERKAHAGEGWHVQNDHQHE